MQSRKHSLWEAVLNTLSGMVISWCASFLIYPALGMGGNAKAYVWATAIFTGISIARTYIWRRLGSWYTHRHQLRRIERNRQKAFAREA